MGWVSGVELPRKFGVQKSGSHGITSTYLKIAICMWNMMINHAVLGCIIFRQAAWLNVFAFPQAISGTHEFKKSRISQTGNLDGAVILSKFPEFPRSLFINSDKWWISQILSKPLPFIRTSQIFRQTDVLEDQNFRCLGFQKISPQR